VLDYEVDRDDAAIDIHLKVASITRSREEDAGIGVKVSVTGCALLE
jgi:hypothetical protein